MTCDKLYFSQVRMMQVGMLRRQIAAISEFGERL
jgi:hypothetical protein